MSTQHTPMTDSQVLESLGYEWQPGNMAIGRGEDILCYAQHHESEEEVWQRAGRYLSKPLAWLELDDALAQRGWETRLDNGYGNFKYLAALWQDGTGMISSHEAEGLTRNATVRTVYERICAAKQETKQP